MQIYYDHSLNYNTIIMSELNLAPGIPQLEETKEQTMAEPIVDFPKPSPEKIVSLFPTQL